MAMGIGADHDASPEGTAGTTEVVDASVVEGLRRYVEFGGGAAILEFAARDGDLFKSLCLAKKDELSHAFKYLLAPLVQASGMPIHL